MTDNFELIILYEDGDRTVPLRVLQEYRPIIDERWIIYRSDDGLDVYVNAEFVDRVTIEDLREHADRPSWSPQSGCLP